MVVSKNAKICIIPNAKCCSVVYDHRRPEETGVEIKGVVSGKEHGKDLKYYGWFVNCHTL